MRTSFGRVFRPVAATAGLAGIVFLGPSAGEAVAQVRLEAEYGISLGGLPIGNGSWVIDISGDRYSIAAAGRVGGLLQVLAPGEGNANIRGSLSGARVAPASYTMATRTRNKLNEVKMDLAGGAVKSVSIEPPPPPDTNVNRVPITVAHKQGVIDPVSASLVLRAGDGLGPDICERTAPIFDGRERFDLTGWFKRMEQVRSERGYQGPAVVCGIRYRPIGGHDPTRTATKMLSETHDIEVWFAPIAGIRYVAAYRVSIPTMVGTAVLQATRFVSVPKDNRAGTLSPQVQ